MSWPPGIWDKINFIVKAFFDPCDAPLTVMAQTAAPALLEALISYYALDLGNIISGYSRPSRAIMRQRGQRKGRWGYKAGRMRKRGILSKAAGYDPGDELGKRLPGAERLRGRVVTGGVVHLWAAFGVIERFNYWWMLISIIIDFFFNWFSALEKTVFCQATGSTVLLATRSDLGQLPIGGWATLPVPDVEKIRGEISWFFSNGAMGDVIGTAVLTCRAVNGADTPRTTGIAIRISGGGPNYPGAQVITTLGPNSEGALTVSCEIPRGAIFTTQDYSLSTAVTLRDVYLSVNGAEP